MNPITEQPSTFIHLKGKAFAEYKIIYHINDGYLIEELDHFSCKHQLLLQKFSNRIQQINLMLVDSVFPIHFADLAIECFLGKVSTFSEYTLSEKQFTVIDKKRDTHYFRRKFFDFILLLLYANISSDKEVCKGELSRDMIYCHKNEKAEIEYFTYYHQRQLQEMLFENLRISIDRQKSFIKKQDLTLCIRLCYP